MFVNIAIGLIIAVIVLYDFVYLPFKHEADATGPKTVQVEVQKDGASPPQDDGAPGITAPTVTAPAIRPGSQDDGQRTADRSGEPPATARDAAAEIAPLRLQIQEDRVRFEALDRDLADTREHLAQALREKTAEEDGRGTAEAAKSDGEAQLDGERKRAADLAAKLTAAEHDAAAQAEADRRQLDAERSRAAALDRDLAGARERLEQASAEKTTAERERGAADAAAQAKLQDGQKHAAELAASLAIAGHDAAAQVQTVQKQLDAERARSAALDRDLAGARERLEQASREGDRSTTAGMAVLRQQADGERARAADLDRDLAAARQLLAQAGTEKAAGEQERRAAEAAAEAKLQGEQKQAAELAAGQMQAMQKQLDGERARAVALDRDLAGARERLEQASAEKTTAERERGAADAAAQAKLQDGQKHAAELAASLAIAGHDAAAQVQTVQKQLDAERARSAALDRDLAGARERLEQASREGDRSTTAGMAVLRQQADGERARAADLDRDLAAARQLLAQAGTEKAAGEQERRAAEAAAEAKLQGEQKQAAELAAAQVQAVQKQLDGERARSATLDRDLAGARERLEQASREGDRSTTVGMAALRQQADGERARAAGLDRDLAATRQLLAQAATEKAMVDQGRRTSEAETEAKLQDEQKRSADLSDRLATAEHDAAQAQVLQKRLDGEQARSTDLDRDLVGTRERLAQALNGKAEGEDERRALATAKAGAEAALQDERKHVADLAGRLAIADVEVGRAPAERSGERSPLTTSSIAAPLPATAPAVPATPLQDGPGPKPQDPPKAADAAADKTLPEDAPVRVVLHYSRGNQTARTQAATFKTTLQSRGVEVGDLVSTSKDNVPDSVVYYYNEDQGNADRVAGILNRAKPVKSRIPKNGIIHPGTIEVTVAG